MPKLIFDIETVGEDFGSIDETTKFFLTNWLKKESLNEEEYDSALEDIISGLGFSPLTGEIVSLGILDSEKNQGGVYFQAPGKQIEDFVEDNIKFKQMSELEILNQFWQIAEKYDEFISFNGRGFDAPFIMIRSAILGIKSTKDLMSNRYLERQKFGVIHVDLMDQLSFYGVVRKKGNLHLWSRVFNIPSPKVDGATGDEVAKLFSEKKFLDIARYNVRDLRATKELYERWFKYLKF